ncbi:hypothetical protein Srufu_004110 [Streptomyces libani subsp. rufus]|nr:hypothetical protein Srufu_004110 [Streptomyces libani subsp. rufus]
MAEFEFTEGITALSDNQLREALVGAFETTSQSTSILPKDLEALRILAQGIESVRGEQAARRAAAEADALSAQVRGGDADTAEGGTGAEGGGVLPDPPAPGTVVTEPVDAPGDTPGAGLDTDDVVRGDASHRAPTGWQPKGSLVLGEREAVEAGSGRTSSP